MIELDLRSRQPIYEQLVERLKTLIISGALRADEQLPSVRQLAAQLTINPNTIQKAYRELETQNYIYSLPGKGNFVSSQTHLDHSGKLDELLLELKRLLAEAIYLGLTKEQLITLFHTLENDPGGSPHVENS